MILSRDRSDVIPKLLVNNFGIMSDMLFQILMYFEWCRVLYKFKDALVCVEMNLVIITVLVALLTVYIRGEIVLLNSFIFQIQKMGRIKDKNGFKPFEGKSKLNSFMLYIRVSVDLLQLHSYRVPKTVTYNL